MTEEELLKDNLDIDVAENEDEDGPIKYEIETYPADYTVTGLISLFKQGKIVIPEFQREYVWKKQTASRLIESILMGIPIPNIFMYKEKGSKDWFVVDGQQRLFSLIYFYEGFFKEEKAKFELTGLDNHGWEGKCYTDLSDLDRDKLDNAVIRTLVINQQDPNDNTSIYHVFKRLNSGGVKLTNQEVRNSVYFGEFNNLLKVLNQFPAWREILGQKKVHNRQKDIELLLRFLALHFWNYYSPMNQFLNDFNSANRSFQKFSKQDIEDLFYKSITEAKNTLGSKYFHSINGRFNIAFFESIMVVLSNNLENLAAIKWEGLEELKKDEKFLALIRATTTSEQNFKDRIEITKMYLEV